MLCRHKKEEKSTSQMSRTWKLIGENLILMLLIFIGIKLLFFYFANNFLQSTRILILGKRQFNSQTFKKEKIKVDQCENQINLIKKKLDEVYTLIVNAKEDRSRAEKDCIYKENQLKVVTNFYEKMEYIQETKDQKSKSYVQRQKEQEIQAIKNYDSKEGVQALRQQIFKLVKQQKILLQNIKTSFDPSYVQDQQKHNSVLQVLSQWEQIKTKAASLRQQVYIKAELHQKQSFKLSGISSQVDQQNLNIENLEKQLQGLKNPFFSSSIQVGHSASQVIETNVFNRRTDENVKRQHRIVQSGYSQLVKYALYLWAFVIIVIFLKESPIARSIQPNISPDLRERF